MNAKCETSIKNKRSTWTKFETWLASQCSRFLFSCFLLLLLMACVRACVWDIADFGKEESDPHMRRLIAPHWACGRRRCGRRLPPTPLTAALYSMLLASLLFDPCFYPTSQSAAASLSTLDRFLFLFTHARTHARTDPYFSWRRHRT